MRLFFTFILSLSLSAVIAQNHQISGNVSDSQGNLLQGVTVSLKEISKSTVTDRNGSFLFSNLNTGNYTLSVKGVGFENLTLKAQSSAEYSPLTLILKPSVNQLKEVTISTTRSKETLGETPVSVTILNAKDIETQASINPNISNILSWSVPGLGYTNNTTSNVGQTLRGRNVLILIDGIPQSTPLRAGSRDIRSIDPAALERIEVIKGATSIYGNGADGGLINYITKKSNPEKKFGSITSIGNSGNLVAFKNSAGGRFSQQFSGSVNKFDYIVSGLYDFTGVFKDAAGEVISPNYGLGETKAYNAFGKFGYSINPDNRIELMYNYFSSAQNSDYIVEAGKYGISPTIGVKGDRGGINEGTRFNHNANLNYSSKDLIGETDLETSVYFQDYKTVYGFDGFFYGGGQSQITSSKKGIRANLITPFHISSDVKGDLTYGLDVLNDVTAQSLVDGRVWVPEVDMRNMAPYAQLNSEIFDHFIFKTGLRYENIAINIDDYQTLATGPANQGSVAVTGGKLDYNALTFNAGLRYTNYNFFKPYVSYSQGFSIFDLGRVLRTASENTIAALNTKPVIVNNYEAGFDSDFNKFSFEGVYYISNSKLGSNLVQQGDIFVPQRAPERVWGYEVLATFTPVNKLSVGASYAYVEGKIDGNNDKDFADDADKYLNSTRISAPKATAFLNVNPSSSWEIRMDYIFSGERKRFQANATTGAYLFGEGPVNNFHLFNFSSSYKVNSAAKLNLGIENIFNKKYYTPVAQFYGRDADYTRGNGIRYNIGLTYSL
ncbi:TonB-dependent receptor [Daejeonella oryzae]|uniref:TonB-dependent receptor n=1 Tax=Daejeonella oryzae TaxID=1122943 RepID=UPI0003FD8F41|nr:TonB-dependent receptor [Daejeonella oryzae]